MYVRCACVCVCVYMLACKDSLTHHPSSQGWAPGVQTFLYNSVVSCMYLDGGMGGRVANYFFTFFSIIYILGLVCYKPTIRVCRYACVSCNTNTYCGCTWSVTNSCSVNTYKYNCTYNRHTMKSHLVLTAIPHYIKGRGTCT